MTTACQRGSPTAASFVSASTRRARGSAIRSANCSTSAGRPQNASMPEMSWLASTRWMPCERPRRATSSSRMPTASLTASLPASSNWNSSITATIRGQRPSGSSARSSSSLVTPCALAASARRRISSARNRSSASPNSRSVLMFTPTSRTCGSQRVARRPGANWANDTPSLKSSR